MKAISESALVKRINRKLRLSGLAVRLAPYGSRSFQDHGRCYVVNDRHHLLRRDVDLESLGRECRALRSGEALSRN
jgi:hypothetical protein